jgi:hypothetical protein
MERKSSIHIEKAKPGEFFHNDRTKPTANSIFSTENNYYNLDALKAIELYRKDIKEKTKKYTERTGRSLHKNTITLLSAIVNLDKQHTQEDLEKICKYLEESLGTKIYQYAIHRDEGFIDEETGEKHINYHAHILFSGLDIEGRSIRKKLIRSYLIKLQDEVAKILKMKRGINYTKERKKRPKRLDTYEYKEHAKRTYQKLQPILKEKEQLKKENEKLKNELAKVKDLKEENKRLREELKRLGAIRQDYAKLEQFIKELKEQVKKRELTIKQMQNKMQELKKQLILEIEKRKEVEQLAYSNKHVFKDTKKPVPFKYLYEQKEKELEEEIYYIYKGKKIKKWKEAFILAKEYNERIEAELERLKKEKKELEEQLRKKREKELEESFIKKRIEIVTTQVIYQNINFNIYKDYFFVLDKYKYKNWIKDYEIINKNPENKKENIVKIETEMSEILDKQKEMDIKFLAFKDLRDIRKEINKILDFIQDTRDCDLSKLEISGTNEKVVNIFKQEIAIRIATGGGKPQIKY